MKYFNLSAYWRLMRFNKPTGILLLWYPTLWALWICNLGRPPINLLVLITIGTLCMRAAGCVVNDIADRNVDKFVARTKLRPIAADEVSLAAAWIILFALLLCAFLVLINLTKDCFYPALLALLITGIYPFCKRIFYAPQLVLGLAFSMGIPMAYVASQKPLDNTFYLLFLINFIWIIAYDTMYAMADRDDDVRINVKSTAILFANYDRLVIGLLQLILQLLWLYWAVQINAGWWFYLFWICAWSILLYQQKLLAKREPTNCLKAFTVSTYYGALMSVAIIGITI